jgi:hypothetical protein
LFIAAAVFAAVNEVLDGGQLVSRGLFAAGFIWMGIGLLLRNRDKPTTS